jgi:hypothetical protein
LLYFAGEHRCVLGEEIGEQKRKQTVKKLLLLVAAAAFAMVHLACAGQEEIQNVGTVMLEEKTSSESPSDKGKELPGETLAILGVIEKPEITPYMYGTHAVTDEGSGVRYALRSEEVGILDAYTGQRATIFGTPIPGYENGAIEGGPPFLNVIRIEPATAGIPGEKVAVGLDLALDGVQNI